MIGNDCRCPGCGTCDAASKVERLRKLADSKNGERIAAEHRAMVAERERDELKARLAHAEADAEQAIHNEAFTERQRIVAWIRAKHLMLSSLAIANCIEQGEHER